MKKKLLALAMFATSIYSFGQVALNEGFEGETLPTGWTTEDTNATNNWIVINDPDYVISGGYSVAVNWIAEDQDESLISPSFSLEGFTSAYFNFNAIVGYEYMVSPNNNGDLFAKISIDGGTTWTELWVEEDEGVFEDYAVITKNIDISAYVGETDVMVKFQYVANDADLVVVDNVSVTGCPGVDVANLSLADLTADTASFTFEGTSVSYDIEWGEAGFELGTGASLNVTEGAFDLTPLSLNTTYEFYLRSNCTETAYSQWAGPFSFSALFDAADLPYEYGFEANGGWSSAGGWTITTNAAVGADVAYEGEGFTFSNTSATAAADAWLYSRSVTVDAGETVNFGFFTGYVASAAGQTANFDLTVGTTSEDQEIIQSFAVNSTTTATYAGRTASWTATEAGTYVFAFHNNSAAVGTGSIILDNFIATTELSTEDFLANQLSIYPNPATDVINVANAQNINDINIVDLNGRIVKSAKFNGASEAQVNISDLSAGMYLMNVSSDQGTTTKKIVKK
ncbi:T9SS type A sorting domain-containing protein [Flavobacterium beibuense]|uniref:T9SS type A sorting domain-containing protein n=1 Tax=Flavobacterium beibuense TaxID=657326 RepID=UPI003A90C3DE